MYTINNLLQSVVEKDASDLHLTVGSPPRIRKNGELISLEGEKLSPEHVENILKEHLTNDRIEKLSCGKEIDFSIGLPGISRFRVNMFKQRGNIVASFRRLPFKIPNIESLGLPPSVIELTNAKKGLILITGNTGSGKSTTMAALIQKISQESKHHIITIEDPIEYLYEHSESLVNQVKRILRNERFLQVIGLYLLLWCGLQLMQTVSLIYLEQVMHVPKELSKWIPIPFQISALIGLQVWSLASTNFGRSLCIR